MKCCCARKNSLRRCRRCASAGRNQSGGRVHAKADRQAPRELDRSLLPVQGRVADITLAARRVRVVAPDDVYYAA